MKYVIAALYHFASVPNIDAVRGPLRALCDQEDIKGSLLVASEGINGTIAGSRAGIDKVLQHIRAIPGFAELIHKESFSDEPVFRRMKVKKKKEIVTMGQALVDPANTVGHYLSPEEWHEFISQDDVVVIDTRNDYEVEIGTFENAINPHTETFREFPEWWEENKSRFHNKRVAMFCTGGIRCEKSTSWLVNQGMEDVYHLKGGILKYLEEMPAQDSKWQGECYVFDERVSVGHGLKQGPYRLCRACGMPMTEEDTKSPDFEEGVSCPKCVDQYDEERKERFRERQKQIELARARGESHVLGVE